MEERESCKNTSCDCDCSVSPGSSICHCRSCCGSFGSVRAFDAHRIEGICGFVGDLVRQDCIWDTPEGHQRRAVATEKMKRAREARGTVKIVR